MTVMGVFENAAGWTAPRCSRSDGWRVMARRVISRLGGGNGAAPTVAVVATSLSPATAAPPVNLATAVADSVLARSGKSATAPLVTTTRETSGWAFGTAVLPTGTGTDEHPDGWLFVAERARAVARRARG